MSKLVSHTAFKKVSEKRDSLLYSAFNSWNLSLFSSYQQYSFQELVEACVGNMSQAIDRIKKESYLDGDGYVSRMMPIYLGNEYSQEEWENHLVGYKSQVKNKDPKRYSSLLRREDENEGFASSRVFENAMLSDLHSYSDCIKQLRNNFPQMNLNLFVEHRKGDGFSRPVICCELNSDVSGDIISHFRAYCNKDNGVKKSAEIHFLK